MVAHAVPVWQHHIYKDFGLALEGTALPHQYEVLWRAARGKLQRNGGQQHDNRPQQPPGETDTGLSSIAASRSGAEPSGGDRGGPSSTAVPMARAPPALIRPFLPFVGLSTDGGFYHSGVWVDHLYKPSPRVGYSSDQGAVSNVHCLAALQSDWNNSRPSNHDSGYRDTLISFLQYPAAYLRSGALCSDKVTTDATLPPLPPDALHHTRAELSTCATEVLEDLFLHCYEEMCDGNPWGALLKGEDGEERRQQGTFDPPPEHLQGTGVQSVHQPPSPSDRLAGIQAIAVQIRVARPYAPRIIPWADPERQPWLRYMEAPLRSLLPGPAPQTERWTSEARAEGQGRVRVRAVRAAERAATLAQRSEAKQLPPVQRSMTIGLFDTVLLGRPAPHSATCPMRCGALFAALAVARGTPAGPSSAATTSAPSAGPSPASGHAGGKSTLLASALTNGLASLECVQALSDATTAACVVAASRSGSLPPIAAYSTNGWLEWIEFSRPPGAGAQGASGAPSAGFSHPGRECQAAQAQGTGPHETDRSGPSDNGACAAHSAGGAVSAPPLLSLPEHGLSVRVLPVLWFRFYTRQERGELCRGARDTIARVSLADEDGSRQRDSAADSQGRDQSEPHSSVAPSDNDRTETTSAAAAAATAAANAAMPQTAAQDSATNPGTDSAATTQSAAGKSAATDRPAAVAAAAAPGNVVRVHGSLDSAAPLLAAEAAPVACEPLFLASPNVTVEAPGVGHMYGWAEPSPADPATTRGMHQLRLRQPWVANLLLAKLVDFEDTHPEVTRQAGGANIDAGTVAVQGPSPPGIRDGGPLLRLVEGVRVA